MATSNASEQHLFHSPNYPQQIESDVDLRHRLGISDMGNSEMSPTKRNSSKHYYQGTIPNSIRTLNAYQLIFSKIY